MGNAGGLGPFAESLKSLPWPPSKGVPQIQILRLPHSKGRQMDKRSEQSLW